MPATFLLSDRQDYTITTTHEKESIFSLLDSVGIPINLFITGKLQWQYVTSPFMHLSDINCVHCYWMFHGEPFAFY
jgi:hypothetical protein